MYFMCSLIDWKLRFVLYWIEYNLETTQFKPRHVTEDTSSSVWAADALSRRGRDTHARPLGGAWHSVSRFSLPATAQTYREFQVLR